MAEDIRDGGRVCEFLTPEENALIESFRMFKMNMPLNLNFRGLAITNEEEEVLLKFRKFRNKLKETSYFEYLVRLATAPEEKSEPEVVVLPAANVLPI